MKKIVSLLLALSMALNLVACGQSATQSSAEPAQIAAHEDIPWDLTDIYPDLAAFDTEFTQAEQQLAAVADLRGKLNTVEGVAAYYAGYDEFSCLFGRLSAYTQLQVYKDQSDSKAKELTGRVDNLSAEMTDKLAYALPELFANSDSFLDAVADNAAMRPYLLWFNRDRAASAHTLPETEERLLQPTYLLRNGAYNLYGSLTDGEITFPSIQFPDGTEKKADEVNYGLAKNGEYTQEFRMEYYDAMMGTYNQYRNTLAQNLQNYYTAVTKSATAHKYDSALEAELAAWDTPLPVYSGVLDAADQAKPELTRYFALLKKLLDVDTLYSFDTNVAICKDPGNIFPYADVQALIKEALAPLGADYAKQLDVLLSEGVIDVYPADNKYSGGFAQQVFGMHPYILLNYSDNFDSASILAHELGHGVHMLYAQTQDTYYGQNVTSITSEVTSTLNELLFSDYMIENAQTQEKRQYYEAQQLSTLYDTFFTQAFFARFQAAAVSEVENGGTLTADKLDELWLKAAHDSFGEGYAVVDAFAGGWERIPHFYMGFYVYQYAVGIAAACNIADRIEAGEAGAVEDYLAFMRAGDSGNVVEMLRLAGVDVSNGDYIAALNARFDRLITEFEKTK